MLGDPSVQRSEYVIYVGKIPKFTGPFDIYEMLRDLKISAPIHHKDIAIQLNEDKETVMKTYIRFSSAELMNEALEAINSVPFFGTSLGAEEKSSPFEPFKFNREYATKGFRLVVYPVLTWKEKADIKSALAPFSPKKFVECYGQKELIVEFDSYETVLDVVKSNCLPMFTVYPDERYNRYLQRVKSGEVLVLPQYNPKNMIHRKDQMN